MLSPLPRRSGWAYGVRSVTQPCQPSPKGSSGRPAHRPFRGLLGVHSRYGLHNALSPIRDTLIEGFSHFVTSMTAPIASGWSVCRVGLAPTGKRRLYTAHTRSGREAKRTSTGRQAGRIGRELPKGDFDCLATLSHGTLPVRRAQLTGCASGNVHVPSRI